jgi:methyl-accepting chemotaxis protein
MRFTDLSVRRTLTLITGLTIVMALAVAGAGVAIYEAVAFRQALTRDLTSLADVVAANSAAALTSDDAAAAGDTLATLRARPAILSAALYKPSGAAIATYQRPGAPPPPAPPARRGLADGPLGLVIARAVEADGQALGTLVIQSDRSELDARQWRTMVIVGFVVLLTLVLTVPLASWLQQRIVEPLTHVSEAARTVSATRDYALRLPATARHDEIGALVTTFNEMLSEIQARDQELERHRGRAHRRAAEGQRARRRLQPRKKRVPGQHEPRDSYTAQRRARAHRHRARHAAHRRTA